MKRIDWYYDIISPFAWLQLNGFDRLPPDVEIVAKPILLGAVLKHWGQLGPAEITPKRTHTYRLVQFEADRRGVAMRFPPRHPFNPLSALRIVATRPQTVETARAALGFVFGKGVAPDNDADLAAFASAVGVTEDATSAAASPDAKEALKRYTAEAIDRGVFGVPTFHADGELFWGDDATAMFLAWLDDPKIFRQGELGRLASVAIGIERKPG